MSRQVRRGDRVLRTDQPEIGRAFFADRLSREAAIFRRAVAHGEITDDVDPALVVDLLGGAVWVRVMLRQEPVPVDFADRVVDAVLSGVMTR